MSRSDPAEAFLPINDAAMARRGWSELDILLVSGDAYVDHPAFGVALLGRLLEAEGLRVGIIAQPDWRNPDALRVMGRPRLFAAVTAGAMDSMVNRYTAAKKVRNDDAYSPGGEAGLRPNRATIAYTAAIKGAFKGLPVVIGGIEASLRRLAHYDYWDDRLRRSILVDSKADLLLYGMAETALLELCHRLLAGEELATITDLRGSALLVRQPPAQAVQLPDYDELETRRLAFNEAYRLASDQANPYNARPLVQGYGERWLLVNAPSLPLQEGALDRIYALPFTRQPHPDYRERIPAYEQIKLSITSHRGCFGGCAFCAIGHHQGKTIQSRSLESIQSEVANLTEHPEFRGTVSDVGGPTANMYGLCCGNPQAERLCLRPSCLYPDLCRNLRTDDNQAVALLNELRQLPKVKHLFVASGIRFDLLERQPDYFKSLLKHHVGGLLKVAPESTSPRVTRIMRKPDPALFESFLGKFRTHSLTLGKRQAVVPYLISGHPGCSLDDMIDAALFLKRHGLKVEQVQEFTPTPGSLATCIYYTGIDPLNGEKIHVPRTPKERRLQKSLLLWHLAENRPDIREALRLTGRHDGQELLADNLPNRPLKNRRSPKRQKRP